MVSSMRIGGSVVLCTAMVSCGLKILRTRPAVRGGKSSTLSTSHMILSMHRRSVTGDLSGCTLQDLSSRGPQVLWYQL